MVKKPVCLSCRILKSIGNLLVERRDQHRADRKCSQQDQILADKKRRLRPDSVLNLRLRSGCQSQANQRNT